MAAETAFLTLRSAECGRRSACSRTHSQTFKLSSDQLFVDKVRDIVGLYLSPPNRALVLSIDEKSQIQAFDREQRFADDAWRTGTALARLCAAW
jgi:hypothetical protein